MVVARQSPWATPLPLSMAIPLIEEDRGLVLDQWDVAATAISLTGIVGDLEEWGFPLNRDLPVFQWSCSTAARRLRGLAPGLPRLGIGYLLRSSMRLELLGGQAGLDLRGHVILPVTTGL
jgi:hypothetical protein